MKKINYLIGAAALMGVISAYSVSAADASVTEACFMQNGETVHTLSNGELKYVIRADKAGADAVMINALYEKDSNKLIGVSYTKASGGEFSNTVSITDAKNTYATMFIWDGIESANAKSQVYSVAPTDPAPENPWNVKTNNKGGVSFTWGASEDNIKTAGYRVYKNGEKIGETEKTSFTDTTAKWYDPATAEYKLTAYDEYGNESDGLTLSEVKIDNSDIAAVLFSQPNITEKMSLYIATGKDTDPTWYGYNTSDEMGGVECRKIPPDRRAVFKISDDFNNRIGLGGRKAQIQVTYYDNGSDAFKFCYVGTSARYATIEVKKTNTNTWITKSVTVDDLAPYYADPVQGNRVQDESVNFTIWSKADSDKGDIEDTETYISEIKIKLEGEMVEESTQAPTLAPGQTPAPTVAPTSVPTPAPTVNPADIKKASIKFLKDQTADSCSKSENDLIHIFWAGNTNDQKINSADWYGYNYGAVANGEECRAIDDDKRLVLIYDEPLNMAIGSTPRNAVIRVKYLDSGNDKFRISYIGKNARYTTRDVVKEDSGEWKWAEFAVTDLVRESDQINGNNGGYQDGKISDPKAKYPNGPNFTIWSRGSGENVSPTEYISEIEIILEADEEEEPTNPPSSITVTQDSENTTLNSIGLTWTDTNENTVGYNVYRNNDKINSELVSGISYVDSDTSEDKDELHWYETYTYKIEAVDADNQPISSAVLEAEVDKSNFGGVKLLAGNTTYDTSYIGEKMTVYWGGTNQHFKNAGWFGYHEGAVIDGIECRKILAAHPKDDGSGWINNQRISLRFNEDLQALIGAAPRNAKIRVKYYDNDKDGIKVSYMSKSNANTNVVIDKEDDKVWKWYTFDVNDLINKSDAGQNGSQDEGTHFSVWSKSAHEENEQDSDTYIAEIQIILADNDSAETK